MWDLGELLTALAWPPSSVNGLTVLPELVWIWSVLLKVSCVERLGWHVRWLAYKALVWSMDSLYWWVHSWTSSEEMRPIRGRRPLRHDFGGCITTQTLLRWVPVSCLSRGKQFSSVMENCLTEAKWPWTETLKQSKSSLLQLVHLRRFVKWHKSWVRHLPGRSVVKFRMIDVNYPNTTLEIEFALKNDCI